MPKPKVQKRDALNLNGMAIRQNPPDAFRQIFNQGPVIQSHLPILGKAWVATSWTAVADLLRNSETFVRDPRLAGRKNFAWMQVLLPRKIQRLFLNNMLTRDGESHRRLRGAVSATFQRTSISKMEPRLTALAQQQLDLLDSQLKPENQPVDLITNFCRPYPLATICELLGLPDGDRPDFMKWFSGMSRVRSLAGLFRLIPMMRRTLRYLESHIASCNPENSPGLLSLLARTENQETGLTRDEIISTSLLLLLAGHETTTHLLSNCLLTLLQRPGIGERLKGDAPQTNAFIDEVLRWAAIIHIAKPRFVTQDLNFHGVALKRGEVIVPCLGSANFDPEVFSEPQEFRLDRTPNPHMTFGNGPHVCLGMTLAKAETRIAIQQILERWPILKPGFPIERPDFGRRIGMRTLNTLKVYIEP